VPVGTEVTLEPSATLWDGGLIAGGSPWRLLRLSAGADAAVRAWRGGGVVGPGQELLARTLVNQGLVLARHRRAAAMSDVDVVVPVLDDAAALDRLLGALGPLAVTVVDDGSARPAQIAQVARRHGARLVARERNSGPAAARNAGLAAGSRPLVWFLDVDVVIDDAWGVLARLSTHLDDPLVGAVAPRVRGVGSGMRGGFEQRHGPLDLGAASALVVPGGRVAYVPSACLLTRRSALGGGFDESLRLGEDVDLVWRLADRGWLVRYDADVVVAHDARGDWPSWWRQRHGYGRSATELARRHGDRLAPVRADAWTLTAWLAVLAGRPRAALAVVALARRQLAKQLPDTVAERERVAGQIAVVGIARAGGPLARAIVRSYGPLLLAAALSPPLRRGALGLFAAGTAWRFWERRALAPADVPLGVADDLAYASGLWRGALAGRSTAALRPRITGATRGLRGALRQSTTTPPPHAQRPAGAGREN
jgi:mycofactocin system glycosyltransferase